ncbi:MAG: CDP-alcohol phosphatidyltransferase family protein [Firmicutes bacterium]|nr:CDP-alcohol phosphatidyltransferase family protein [Bacillota bacterium]MCM1400552.1 CDP-alcohol phosphatidyltransferase family protein [Bacteroides sp.]MCM1476456.1 CDP-alcohol phosphatidyltransferase family protein [Bacteroides sp.]
MKIKETAVNTRGSLQQGIYCVINPFVHLLIKMGVTPNMVTTIGLLGNLAAAAVLVWAGYDFTQTQVVDWGLLTLAGALIIGFSLFDMLDGQVARLGNMASTFGAMYDSVLDRYCELATLGAVSYFLIQVGHTVGALVTFLALVGSIMVSYVRARAEGLGIECKIGFLQRPERVVITSAAVLATGISGQCDVHFDSSLILIAAMAFIALFANLTAFARVSHSKKALKAKGK